MNCRTFYGNNRVAGKNNNKLENSSNNTALEDYQNDPQPGCSYNDNSSGTSSEIYESGSDEYISSNTDSEEETDTVIGKNTITNATVATLTTPKNDIWNNVTGSNQQKFPFIGSPSTNITVASDDLTPFGAYSELVSQEIFQFITNETNKNAKQKLGNNRWIETDMYEIRKFVGIVAYMGVIQYPKISDYWSKSEFYKNNFVPKIMSRNRFQQLLRYIHFSDNTIQTDDRLCKVTPLIDALVQQFQKIKTPDENVVIDESMVPFRGRLIFKQYLPGKSSKYGIKVFKLCDTKGYTYNIKVYAGRDNVDYEERLSNRVVFHLINNYLEEGRTLIVDNFYTNVDLAHSLLSKNTHLVGTMRKNTKHVPKVIFNTKLKKGQIIGQENDKGVVVACWKDKRDVRFLSTRHTINMVDSTKKTRRGEAIIKPEAIIFYNKCKQGIDVSDQMSSYFSPLRKTIRWYHKVAFELLLGTSVVNALIIFKNLTGKNMQISEFRRLLIQGMVSTVNPVVNRPAASTTSKHYLQETSERLTNNRKKRRRCVGCYQNMSKAMPRSEVQKRCKLVSTFCAACSNDKGGIYMCLQCFQDMH